MLNTTVCLPGVLDSKKLDWPLLFKMFITLFQYITADEASQVNGFVFLIDFTGIGGKLLKKMMNKEVEEFESSWAVS